ncbi:hypothetical protein JCM1841_005302 [Sporobolomyces salmonicolor]
METEPGTAASPPSAFPPQPDFTAFQDLLASHPSPSNGNGADDLASSGHVFSPGQQNFADLLAEFTLPGNAMSAMSPQGGDPAMERTPDAHDQHQRAASEGAAHFNMVQETLMEQLKMSYAQPNGQRLAEGQPSSGTPSPVSAADGAAQHGGIDFQMQLQQLLASTLASSTNSQTPPSTQHAPSPQHHHHQQHFAPHLQQHPHSPYHHSGHYSSHSSPGGLHSQPPSHAASPMPMYHHPTTTSASSAGYAPVAVSSPYIIIPPGYAGPLPQGIAMPAAYAQQFAVQGQQQQQAANLLVQAQAFIQANQGQTVMDGTSTSTSHATSADGEWRENEFMFSPLMSPAMTPHTPFTTASSLPPSVGPLPLVSPADCFPPLTSPALGPQLYSSDHPRVQHRNSLQGLVDGVGSLSTQLPPGSPSSFYQSPGIGPNDTGTTTAAGSGRRGAGSASKKTRPSPLIKPTDPTLDHRRRRKPTNPAVTTQNGTISATSSPFLGATNPSTSGGWAASTPGGVSTSSGSQKASPPEHASAPSTGSIDTPSPVDLAGPPLAGTGPDGLPVPPASIYGSLKQQPAHQQLPHQPYQLELMGPPPPPSSQQHQSFNPVTPATIMNFASGFDLDALSSLSSHLGPTAYDPTGSACSSVQNSPMLLPRPDSSLPSTTMSAAGKARSSRKSVSSKPSPALRPVDAKGKGKSDSTDSPAASGRKGASKPAKIAPNPKIGPSPKIRPLLSSDAAPDAQARLASKSNYENILEGRGSDLLGLPSSTLSALQGPSAASGGADNRRSTHKIAEQKRRDSLKLCFDELRKLLPPILPSTADDADRRPGEGNVGGQRNGEVDPDNPNKGVSKVALLRRSNEYLDILRERIERRDRAIAALRAQNMMLREQRRKAGRCGMQQQEEEQEEQEEEEEEEEGGENDEEVPGLDLDLDNIDKEERRAGNLAFYEDLDFETKIATLVDLNRRPSTSGGPRQSATPAPPKAVGRRRSSRTAQNAAASEATAMDVEDA